jgi:hypothetical protein
MDMGEGTQRQVLGRHVMRTLVRRSLVCLVILSVTVLFSCHVRG